RTPDRRGARGAPALSSRAAATNGGHRTGAPPRDAPLGGRHQKSRGNRRPAAEHGVGTENNEKSKNPRRRNPDGGAHKCQRQRDRAQRGNSTKQAESSVSEWKRAV